MAAKRKPKPRHRTKKKPPAKHGPGNISRRDPGRACEQYDQFAQLPPVQRLEALQRHLNEQLAEFLLQARRHMGPSIPKSAVDAFVLQASATYLHGISRSVVNILAILQHAHPHPWRLL